MGMVKTLLMDIAELKDSGVDINNRQAVINASPELSATANKFDDKEWSELVRSMSSMITDLTANADMAEACHDACRSLNQAMNNLEQAKAFIAPHQSTAAIAIATSIDSIKVEIRFIESLIRIIRRTSL